MNTKHNLSIAIVNPWPTGKNSERETIERIKIALEHLDVNWIVVDGEGYVVESASKIATKTSIDEVADLCISLHFVTPKIWSTFTYHALWNPPRYPHLHKKPYSVMMSYVGSYDDYIGYDSTPILNQISNYFTGTSKEISELLDFFPGGCEPTYPALENLPPHVKLFYCGVNWEVVYDGGRARYGDLIHLLDSENIINIYGPEFFENIRPWDGFKNYKGSIPYDGQSMPKYIRESGIALVLSSEDHIQSGVASSRIYEALAAGVIILADKNPFIVREFGDTINYFDYGTSPRDAFHNIKEAYRSIINNPNKFLRKATEAQKIYKEKHLLEGGFKKIIEAHPSRVKSFKEKHYSRKNERISILFPVRNQTLEELTKQLHGIENQDYKNFSIHIICDERRNNEINHLLKTYPFNKQLKISQINTDINNSNSSTRNIGFFIRTGLESLKDNYFTIIDENEIWLPMHLTTLARCLEDDENINVSISGSYFEDFQNKVKSFSHLEFSQDKYKEILGLVKSQSEYSVLFKKNNRFFQEGFLRMIKNLDTSVKNVLLIEALNQNNHFASNSFIMSSLFLKDLRSINLDDKLTIKEKMSLGFILDYYRRDQNYLKLLSNHSILFPSH
jgi:hypothetical protein